jgi:hypothetical protein
MPALFHNPPVIDYQDKVGIANSRQPVGDDYRSPSFQEMPQTLLEDVFAVRVDAGGSFIQ